MTDYDKTYQPFEFSDETFFAGANSRLGFRNLFSDLFDEAELEALYIIKGGPGTGKSTFMKNLAAEAKANGVHTCTYVCGSDPESLDAVVMSSSGKTVAIIDGTSPHAYDARFPGAVSHILDFGSFLDKTKLLPEREKIIELVGGKSNCYARAYRYLNALAVIRSDVRDMVYKALDTDKMKSACFRMASNLAKDFAEPSARIRRRTFEGTTMRGICSIDFEGDSPLISVCDVDLTFPYFMAALSEALIAHNVSHTVLTDSTESEIIRGLLIDQGKIRVLPFSKKPDGVIKNVNMGRFVSTEKLKNSRNKRSFAKKCALSVADGARESLAEAAKYHFALEEIYKRAMDFSALTAKCEIYTKEILSHLT